MVIGLAGRRIDGMHDTTKRFPAENIGIVENRLTEYFLTNRISQLVCSAASGADLIALKIAAKFAIVKNIVLPFNETRFKNISVTDTDLSWGQLFDWVITNMKNDDTLLNLN